MYTSLNDVVATDVHDFIIMQAVAYNAVNLCAVFSQCGPILDLWST